MTIQELQKKVHAIATEKGWHDKPRSIGDLLANVHAEVSEAFEEYRKGVPIDHIYYEGVEGREVALKPCGFPIELADVIIRIADMAEEHGINLKQAIIVKNAYNETRSYCHGGKLV